MLQATLSLYLQNIVQRYPTFVQGCFTLKTLVYQIQLMSLFQLEWWLGVIFPMLDECSGLCFCFFFFFSFFLFFLSLSSSCRFCFLCFFSCESPYDTSPMRASGLDVSPDLYLCFLCLFLCLFDATWFAIRYCSGRFPGCKRNPASCTLVRGRISFPQMGGFSITERRELLSWLPGASIIPGRLGRNDDRDSFSFLPQNLL